MHLFALPLSTLPLLAQATPPPNPDVTTVWSTVWIPLLWLCGSILFGLVVLFFTYRFLLRTHQTRALKKFHALFSLLPFQAGVTSQNGRMLTYRSGQGDPIEDEDIPKTVSDLPAELQSEVQAEFLRGKFGAQYEDYCARVGRFFPKSLSRETLSHVKDGAYDASILMKSEIHSLWVHIVGTVLIVSRLWW